MGLQISKQVRCVTNIRAKGFSQGRRMLGTARFQSRSANTWCRTDRVQRTGEAVYYFILQAAYLTNTTVPSTPTCPRASKQCADAGLRL